MNAYEKPFKVLLPNTPGNLGHFKSFNTNRSYNQTKTKKKKKSSKKSLKKKQVQLPMGVV